MTSSSGQVSGASENADCFPVVEQMTLDSNKKLTELELAADAAASPLQQVNDEYGGKQAEEYNAD